MTSLLGPMSVRSHKVKIDSGWSWEALRPKCSPRSAATSMTRTRREFDFVFHVTGPDL
jgi:hypothetical protein